MSRTNSIPPCAASFRCSELGKLLGAADRPGVNRQLDRSIRPAIRHATSEIVGG